MLQVLCKTFCSESIALLLFASAVTLTTSDTSFSDYFDDVSTKLFVNNGTDVLITDISLFSLR